MVRRESRRGNDSIELLVVIRTQEPNRQNSGACAEVLAKGDHVALRIGHHRFPVEPWHSLDRGGFKPALPKLSNKAIQVVHQEREQGLPGAAGVTDHVDPSSLYCPPHGFVFRHDDIWGPSEEALVPRERRVVVGHGNASEDIVDGQWSLLCPVLRLALWSRDAHRLIGQSYPA